jgi:hypothetical protein
MVSRAAEPIFPSLAAQAEEHLHEDAPEDHHHNEITITPEHDHEH